MKTTHNAILSLLALLVMLLGPRGARADVIYTRLPELHYVSPYLQQPEMPVDFNGDGVVDARLFGSALGEYVAGQGSFVGVCQPQFSQNYCTPAWQEIGPASSFTCPSGYPRVENIGCDSWSEMGCGCCWAEPFGIFGYLGARFQIAGRTHYGWILVTAPNVVFPAFYVAGYAYESVADRPIFPQVPPDCLPVLLTEYTAPRQVLVGRSLSLWVEVDLHTQLSPGFSMQWLLNDEPIEDGNGVEGAQTSTLSIASISTEQAGEYRCRITLDCGETLSTPISVSVVLPCPHIILPSPRPERFLPAGDTLILELDTFADASSYTQYSGQWFHDGVALVDGGRISGATTDIVHISSVTAADTGVYTWRLTTDCGESTSEPIYARVIVGECAPFDGFALRSAGGTAATTLLNSPAATVEAWVLWRGGLFPFLTSTGMEHLRFAIGHSNEEGSLRFVPAPGVYLDTPANALHRGEWAHIAGVYDPAAGIAKVYVNGIEQNVVSSGTAPATTPMPTNDATPFLVSRRHISQDNRFIGNMDEVRVWNHARTQAQIVDSMRRSIALDESGLLALYHFDEGAGTVGVNSAASTGAALDLLLEPNPWAATELCCPGDLNHDGEVDSTDFFSFLNAFFAGHWDADINVDFQVDSTDFFDFLSRFFAGC